MAQEPILISQLAEASDADITDSGLAVVSVADAGAATGYTTKRSLLSRIKKYIIGNTPISSIGDGTVTGAVAAVNDGLANVGTVKTGYLTTTTSIPDNTATALTGCNITLSPGVWIIIGKVTYQGGTAGTYRQARIGTTATGNEYGIVQFDGASNNRSAMIAAIATETASRTFYLSAQHGNGSATNAAGGRLNTFIMAVRVGDY